jgi:hypothetical protein
MKYYYLISSLPDLQIDDTALSQEQLEELIESIDRNSDDKDRIVLRCLLHSSDNQNLLYVLFREYHDFEIRSYSRPGSIPIDTLENYRREFSSLPDYMINYLNDLSGSFASLTLREMEHILNQYYHDYLLKVNSLFLNTYFLWRFRLKHTIAGLNLKAYPFLRTQSDTEEPFYHKVRELHGLTDQDDIANQLLPLIEGNELEAIEHKTNEFYWEFADCWQEPFSSEQVFAYMVKLIRLHRWKGFSSKGEVAQSKFEALIAELKQKKSSYKMPVI